jgi:hypothetical protein
MPGDWHPPSFHALEQELQSELNEPRVVQLTGHKPEVRVIGCQQTGVIATNGVGKGKLDAIKRVEELRPELQAELVLRAKVRGLE